MLLQTASLLYQTLDVYDWAALEALKCEPYQMLGSKNSFSFRLGLSFSSIVSGKTHICLPSHKKVYIHAFTGITVAKGIH